jgi:hypothetical protein
MSTRACYVFKHENQNDVRKNDITIYKHHDGYPAGAISWIKATIKIMAICPITM